MATAKPNDEVLALAKMLIAEGSPVAAGGGIDAAEARGRVQSLACVGGRRYWQTHIGRCGRSQICKCPTTADDLCDRFASKRRRILGIPQDCILARSFEAHRKLLEVVLTE